MSYIPEEIVERVRESSDIATVVGGYVKLKRRGKNLIGLCPFHQEKTPSFTVSPDKQIFHCFGCGKGGNVFSFMIDHERMSFPESVRHLAERAGITIPETGSSQDRDEREKLFYVHQLAQEVYERTIRDSAHRSIFVEYLQKKRGLSEETIAKFGIGLAPDSRKALTQLVQSKGISPEILLQAGLGLRGDRGENFDRFRYRLMIPIYNLSDKIIAYGGRALRDTDMAKYMNSPETPLYSKSSVLYGLNFSRDAIRDSNTVIIVEGYFDMISLYQAGIRNVVASSGTAFTEQQGRLISRFADKAILFFDSDSAGVKAAIKSVDSLYNAGVEVMVASAPQGEDPDSLARSGAARVQDTLDRAERYIRFRLRGFDATKAGLVEKGEFVHELAAIAGRITDNSLRTLFAQEAAEGLNMPVEALLESQPAQSSRESQAGSRARMTEDDWGARDVKTIEAEALSLILAHPVVSMQAREKLKPENFQTPKLSQLFVEMISFFENERHDTALFIGSLKDEKLRQTASFLATRRWDTEHPGAALNDYILRIKSETETKRSIAELKSQLKAAESAGDADKASKLAEQLVERMAESKT